jgi:hypothetical protein
MSTLTDSDILKLYDGGYYNICKGILSDFNTNNVKLLIISLILGNAKKENINLNLIGNDNLLLGAWNLSLCDVSVDTLFYNSVDIPIQNEIGNETGNGNGNGIKNRNETKNSTLGVSLLQKINNQHSNYLLFKYYIANQQGEMANSYLMASAKLNCHDAIATINSIGLIVDDTDQCFDHCQIYCGTSDAQNICGCGPYKSGWVFGSCLICGCKTSLSCVDIASYTTSGFIGLLQSVYQPLKLAACISSIVALGLQQSNSPYLSTAIFLSTSFTTLVTFINKDVQKQNELN